MKIKHVPSWLCKEIDEQIRNWYENCEGRHKSKHANAQELIAKMDLFGYTVEKEKLYYVDFIKNDERHIRLIVDNENGVYDIVEWSRNLVGIVEFMFTESEIKSIDERYWAFAVKAEEEE